MREGQNTLSMRRKKRKNTHKKELTTSKASGSWRCSERTGCWCSKRWSRIGGCPKSTSRWPKWSLTGTKHGEKLLSISQIQVSLVAVVSLTIGSVVVCQTYECRKWKQPKRPSFFRPGVFERSIHESNRVRVKKFRFQPKEVRRSRNNYDKIHVRRVLWIIVERGVNMNHGHQRNTDDNHHEWKASFASDGYPTLQLPLVAIDCRHTIALKSISQQTRRSYTLLKDGFDPEYIMYVTTNGSIDDNFLRCHPLKWQDSITNGSVDPK